VDDRIFGAVADCIDDSRGALLSFRTMPRTARVAPGGHIYHVLNRSVGKSRLFGSDADFEAFERIITEAHARQPLSILAYSILPTHWQFVVWPKKDGQLTDFFRWLAHTHAMRRKRSRRKAGAGRLYQSRYKSFLVQRDQNLLTVLQYVEQTPVTSGLVEKAQLWRFGSLWARKNGDQAIKSLLAPWPIETPANWTSRVNTPLSQRELERVRISIERSRPFGTDDWVRRTTTRLGLEHTIRPEGRPPKLGHPVFRASE
jgi:putative transposase